MKNLVIKKRDERKESSTAIKNGKCYESLENGNHDGELNNNGYCLAPDQLDPKCKTSTILKVTRTLQSPVAMLKKKKVKLSNDVKVKRCVLSFLLIKFLLFYENCSRKAQIMLAWNELM